MTWLANFEIGANNVGYFTESLEEYADSISCFENEQQPDLWQIRLYFEHQPDNNQLKFRLNTLASAIKIPDIEYDLGCLDDIDWVIKSQKDFKPVETDKFFIHASWFDGDFPEAKNKIEIDPQRAFGTGGHQTTKGCIIALENLHLQEIKPGNIIDMGCGSGILAIAAAILWPESKIMAVDNDNISVETADTNAALNNVMIESHYSEGYNSQIVQQNKLYNLVVANILAAPLIEMASDAASVIAPSGYLILSGILDNQSEKVVNTYTEQGLKLLEQTHYDDWVVLLFKKAS